MSRQHTFAIAHGPDWTHTLGKSTFLDVSLRQNYRKYQDRAYADAYDWRYDAATPPNEPVNDPASTGGEWTSPASTRSPTPIW